MRALCYESYGNVDVLDLRDTNVPDIEDDEVLVQVHTASLNPFDWKLRSGMLRNVFDVEFPITPGRDGYGKIVAIGKNAQELDLSEGQLVSFISSRLRQGSLAEYAAVSAKDNVVPAATNLTPQESAALPLVGLSAWNALVDTAEIQSGMRVLIHGGSGGVGARSLDENGSVIRRFSNEAAKEDEGGFVKGVIGEPPSPSLDTNKGMNRYIWNLRTERYTEVSDTIRYVSTRPYRVAPGTYHARLMLNGESITKSFEVIPDPRRDEISAQAWNHQQELLSELGAMVNEVHSATNHMRSVAADVSNIIVDTTSMRHEVDQLKTLGQALIEKINAWEIHVPQPELPNNVQDLIAFPSRLLSTQILHVMRAIDQDPPVTAGSELRTQELRDQWSGLVSDMFAILDNDLREFNELLGEYEIPVISSSPVE